MSWFVFWERAIIWGANAPALGKMARNTDDWIQLKNLWNFWVHKRSFFIRKRDSCFICTPKFFRDKKTFKTFLWKSTKRECLEFHMRYYEFVCEHNKKLMHYFYTCPKDTAMMPQSTKNRKRKETFHEVPKKLGFLQINDSSFWNNLFTVATNLWKDGFSCQNWQ